MPSIYRFNECRELGRNGNNVTYEAVDPFRGELVILIGWHAEAVQEQLNAMERATGAEMFSHEGSCYLVTTRDSAASIINALHNLDFFHHAWTGFLAQAPEQIRNRPATDVASALPITSDINPSFQSRPFDQVGEAMAESGRASEAVADRGTSPPENEERWLPNHWPPLIFLSAAVVVLVSLFLKSPQPPKHPLLIGVFSSPANLPAFINAKTEDFTVTPIENIQEELRRDPPYDILAIPLLDAVERASDLNQKWRLVWIPTLAKNSEHILISGQLDPKVHYESVNRATDGDRVSKELMKEYMAQSESPGNSESETTYSSVKELMEARNHFLIVTVHGPVAFELIDKYDFKDSHFQSKKSTLIFSTAILVKERLITGTPSNDLASARAQIHAFLKSWTKGIRDCGEDATKSQNYLNHYKNKPPFSAVKLTKETRLREMFASVVPTPEDAMAGFFYGAEKDPLSCKSIIGELNALERDEFCGMLDRTFLEERQSALLRIEPSQLKLQCRKLPSFDKPVYELPGFPLGEATLPEHPWPALPRFDPDKCYCAIGSGGSSGTPQKNNEVGEDRATTVAKYIEEKIDPRVAVITSSLGNSDSPLETRDYRRVRIYQLGNLPSSLIRK